MDSETNSVREASEEKTEVEKPVSPWDQYLTKPSAIDLQDQSAIPDIVKPKESMDEELKNDDVWEQYLHKEEPDKIEDSLPSTEEAPALFASEPEPGVILISENLILSKLEGIQQQLDALHQEFQERLSRDAQKDKIIDNLYQELQEYKTGVIKKHLKSLVMDIIKIIDNIRKIVNHYNAQNPSEADPVKLLKLVESISSELEDLLELQDVNAFTCNGGVFDPRRQRVLKTVETSDKSKDKSIAESVRPGYEWEGQVIRPEMVAVHVYKELPVQEETNILREMTVQTEMRNSNE